MTSRVSASSACWHRSGWPSTRCATARRAAPGAPPPTRAALQVAQRHAGRRHLRAGRQARLCFGEAPHQLLAHGQHMAIGVRLGDEGVRHGRRGEEEHRPRLQVLALVEIDPHRAVLHVVHLEETVVPVRRHVATEESGQVAQRIVVHLGVGIALVVDLPNVDVGDRLALWHGDLLFVVLPGCARKPSRASVYRRRRLLPPPRDEWRSSRG